VRDRYDIGDNEKWRLFEVLGKGLVEELLEEMDENDVECVFMDQTMQWSQDSQEEMVVAIVEELAELRDKLV